MDAIRFAIVGAGGIAQSYAQAFENNPFAKLVAVADTRSDACASARGKSRLSCLHVPRSHGRDRPKFRCGSPVHSSQHA